MNREEITSHLAEVLASTKFVRAPDLTFLLRYLVEHTLDDKGDEVREYVLGVDVFHRGTDFDPKVDSIVRVQARRLRQKLSAYYAEVADHPRLRISLQPGSYIPSFDEVTTTPRPGAFAIAVLPFAAIGSAPGDVAYLSDGFTDELIHAISRIPQTRVVARTSSFAGREAGHDARDSGRRLGVRRVITGSLRWNEGSVTVLAQLVDVESGLQEWSERWDQPEQLLFTLPAEIARAVASALHRGTSPTLAPIDHPEALQLFLRGRYYWNQRTEQGFRRAVEYYQQALDLDPAMSRIWAALSETYLLLAMHGLEPPRDVLPKAKVAAERGLLFDPRSAACHAAHGAALLFLDRDVSRSETAWRAALDLDPLYVHAWHSYAIFFLASQRRWDEAMSAILEAERLDPLSAPIANDIAFILYWSGNIERARSQCKRAIDAYPWFYRTYMLLARCHAAEGDLACAIDIARRALPLFKGREFYTYHLATLGFCDARAGNTAAAELVLAEMEAIGTRHYYSKIDRALVYHGLRDRSRAVQWIDQAAQDKNPWEFLRLLDPLWQQS